MYYKEISFPVVDGGKHVNQLMTFRRAIDIGKMYVKRSMWGG